MRHVVLQLLTVTLLFVFVIAWTKEDHEIFRLHDEILATEGPNVTFYDFLGIKSNANQDDISKAYRKKSRLLHPDKVKRAFIANSSKAVRDKRKGKKPGVHASKGPSQRQVAAAVKEAHERTARLNIVANILRSSERERYDHFLKNGFPKWRGTGYYYSRFRPGLGTVLLGLFLTFGGAAHYVALILSWKRRREFIDRYIRHARKAAWGDEVGISGVLGLDSLSTTAPTPTLESDVVAINRRQKRMMEKENRKEGKKGGKGAARNAGSAVAPVTPSAGNVVPPGQRKRVVAENGKVLIVDSVGTVFLEEENEDGEPQELLLDISKIPRPTVYDTVLFQLPLWCYRKTVGRLLKGFSFYKPLRATENIKTPATEAKETSAAAAAREPFARKRGRKVYHGS